MSKETLDPCRATPERLVTVNALHCGNRQGHSRGIGVDPKHMLDNVVFDKLRRLAASELRAAS